MTLLTVALCLWDYSGKCTGVSCHFFLQGIFPAQGSNLCPVWLLHWQADFSLLSHLSVSCSVMLDSVTPWTVAHQAPLSMEFSRQEHWSGVPFPSPEHLPDPGNEPRSVAGRFFTISGTREALPHLKQHYCCLPFQSSSIV